MLELYRLPGCPFCRKVEQKLSELDLEYIAHDVPASKSQRDEVEAVSGQRGVPVLIDDEHGVSGMAESADIITYLEETYA